MKYRALILGAALFTMSLPIASAQKALTHPQWRPGETFFYLIHQKIDRNVRARSALSLPTTPTEGSLDVTGWLQVDVLDSGARSGAGEVRLRTIFHPLNAVGRERLSAEGKPVECFLRSDGQMSGMTGLTALAPEEQEAWREWATQFSAAFLVSQAKRKRGEKWNSEETETSPSPIAELRWQKKSHYVRDEPCSSLKFDASGNWQHEKGSESCAVILTTATLQQKSSSQDATPEDYRLRSLQTRGTAKGSNETIFYISRKTGLLVRATQDAKQTMDVLISEIKGGSQVHYAVTASSNSTVELLNDVPQNLKAVADK